jgi:hypothetical protein
MYLTQKCLSIITCKFYLLRDSVMGTNMYSCKFQVLS